MTTSQLRPNDRPLDSFEAQLLGDLRLHVAQRDGRVTAHRSRRRTFGMTVAAGAAAIAASLGIATLAAPAAFAVTTSDGDIVVRIHELTDADGLEAALAKVGITAQVEYGGKAGNVMSVDSNGKVTSGDETFPQTQGDGSGTGGGWPAGLTDDGRAGHRDGSAAAPVGPDGGPCGSLDTLPVTVNRDGGDYVITIAQNSEVAKADLSITTFSRDASVEMVVSFSPADGLRCGIGTGIS